MAAAGVRGWQRTSCRERGKGLEITGREQSVFIDCAPNVYTHSTLRVINLGYRKDTTLLGSFLVTYGSYPSIQSSLQKYGGMKTEVDFRLLYQHWLLQCEHPVSDCRYWKAAIRSPQSLLLSRLDNPKSLSLSSLERYSSPLIIFVALLWTRSNRSMSFLCWGSQSWTQYCRSVLNPFSAQPVFVLGIAPTHVQDLTLGLVELHFARADLSSLSTSLWMASLPSSVSTAPYSLVSSANLLRVHSVPLSMLPKKMLNSTGPSTDP
ncbi:hypothetical protein QYF61_012830 [Mycteria americana]|uniref:Uncharacterized protein n=1 Tax=Mycteria americana TaxID=33587 RepID=A0AAN7S0X9_MYCAM|nr:hypothetical protein QYF61_012830 [Mycteria americana]